MPDEYRILLAIESSGAGSGRHVLDLARGLSRVGHEVVLAYSPKRAEETFLQELHEIPLRAKLRIPMDRSVGVSDAKAALALGAAVRRYGPFDILHGHSSKAGSLVRLIPRGTSKVVYTPHKFRTMDQSISGSARIVYASIESLLGNSRTDAVIAVSEAEREHARYLRIPERKLFKVVNGLGPAPNVSRTQLRARLGIDQNDFVAGFVGRLCHEKGPDRFLTAVDHCARAGLPIKGVIVGDGELLDELKSRAGAIHDPRRLKFLGNQNGRQIMPAFDMLAFPSRNEAMPYVLIEALLAGLPIVATDVGGARETVIENRNGYVIPQSSTYQGLASAITRIATNPELCRSMAANSLTIAREFTIERMVAETESVYRSVVRPRTVDLRRRSRLHAPVLQRLDSSPADRRAPALVCDSHRPSNSDRYWSKN